MRCLVSFRLVSSRLVSRFDVCGLGFSYSGCNSSGFDVIGCDGALVEAKREALSRGPSVATDVGRHHLYIICNHPANM